jgi:hypothetical protein
LVCEFHRREKIDLPDEMLHAVIHVVVENQVAARDQLIVEEKLNQLMREGLDRHDAVHAIGSVLIEHIYNMRSGDFDEVDPNERYLEALEQLTAESWRENYSG